VVVAEQGVLDLVAGLLGRLVEGDDLVGVGQPPGRERRGRLVQAGMVGGLLVGGKQTASHRPPAACGPVYLDEQVTSRCDHCSGTIRDWRHRASVTGLAPPLTAIRDRPARRKPAAGSGDRASAASWADGRAGSAPVGWVRRDDLVAEPRHEQYRCLWIAGGRDRNRAVVSMRLSAPRGKTKDPTHRSARSAVLAPGAAQGSRGHRADKRRRVCPLWSSGGESHCGPHCMPGPEVYRS